MARTIAGTSAASCYPAKVISLPSLSLPSCRFSDSLSMQHSLGSKQSLIFVGNFRHEDLFVAQPWNPTNVRLSPIVDCDQRPEKPGLPGARTESGIIQSSKNKSGDGTRFLAVAEGVCIVVAGASYTASVLQKSHQTATIVGSSSSVNNLFAKLGDFSCWQVPALWAALVINALLRSIQSQSTSNTNKKTWEEKSIKDFTVDQRVGKLEEDVQSVAAIARMLSRHMEKLGVRFRVTRRTLQDPIQGTAVLAQKTMEVVTALATRENMLEAQLRQTQQELRDTQQTLVSMQASQEKQLELLVTSVTKSMRSQKLLEERISKDVSRRLSGTTNKGTSKKVTAPVDKKSVASVGSGKPNLSDKFGGLEKSLTTNLQTPTRIKMSGAQAVEAEKAEFKKELIGNNKNGDTRVPGEKTTAKKSTFKPDTSFTKEDFWSSTPTTSAADLTVEHEVVDYLTGTDRTTDALPKYADNPQGSGRLDSFFSGRKNINSYQAPINLSSQDYHNPGFSSIHSQSGDYSSGSGSGRHRDYTMSYGLNLENAGQGKENWLSPEVVTEVHGGSLHSDFSSWSNLSAGDNTPGSASGSPCHSNWSSTSAWDFTLGSGSHRHSSWYNTSAMDCSSGSGSPRMGEGFINFVQSGFVDTDIMREFKDGYTSS